MANPINGEVSVTVSAGTFTLAFTLGACAAIEGASGGRPLNEVLAELNGDGAKFETVTTVLWAALRKHHNLTRDEVGDLVTLAEMPAWSAAMTEAFAASQPEATGKERPRKATAG